MEIIFGVCYQNLKNNRVNVYPEAIETDQFNQKWVNAKYEGENVHIRADLFNAEYKLHSEVVYDNHYRKLEIRRWGENKDIIKFENRFIQLAKLLEEAGELANALIKGKEEDAIDALGDCRIVLNLLAEQLGYDIDYCEQKAFDVIKNRTGKTINGTFIKSEDL